MNKTPCYLKNKKPNINVYENAVILPRLSNDDSYPLWGLGGVCDSNNEYVQSSFYDGGWATFGGTYPFEQEVFIDEEVVYFGLLLNHWGHFLIDITTRIWPLNQLCQDQPKIKVAYLGEEEPSGNVLRFFELMGVRKEQLIHITEPTRFRKVYVPEQGFKSCEWYTDEHLQMLDLIVVNALNSGTDFSELEGLKKVYFTRRSFSKALSSEFGEEYFERIFVDNGFISIAPETLSLDQQIYLWNNADEIVCVNGSIPLNVMFSCNNNLKLTVLNKTSIPHDNPMILLKMRGIEATFLNVYNEPVKGYPKSLGEGPYLFWPTEEFNGYIYKHSLINSISEKEIRRYFSKQKIKFLASIISFRRKIKNVLVKIVPGKIKEFYREKRKYQNE